MPGPALEGTAELARVGEADVSAHLADGQVVVVQQLQRAFGTDAVVQAAEADAVGGQLPAQRAFAQVHRPGNGRKRRILAHVLAKEALHGRGQFTLRRGDVSQLAAA
ncbi:hypothetical protein DT603_03890 [Pseudoxanthomonas gei]|uniref:Uncharacterized protein n=1 Tax=Pseudoxanthomonas gei TaxID=1383030 RepID=A0ABX0ACU1_9GAMM|nr:hypothetical protein [Pseudoxanthomonas gei]